MQQESRRQSADGIRSVNVRARHRPGRVAVALLAAVACAAFAPPLATAHASATPKQAAAPRTDPDPWQTPNYVPQPGQWRPYVLAPSSRMVPAVAVAGAVANQGTITNPKAAVPGARGGDATLTYGGTDPGSSPRLTLDMGKEVGGRLELTVSSTSASPPKLYAAFSESLLFMSTDGTTGTSGDLANNLAGDPASSFDYEAHPIPLTSVGSGTAATVVDPAIRGGFRYVALFLESPGSVSFHDVKVAFTPAPTMTDPADYRGWFLSSSNELNKLWYSSAYTVQMDTIDPATGKCIPPPVSTTDDANCTTGEGNSILVDGAKRDRLPWGFTNFEPQVAYVSTQDYASTLANIKTRLDEQQPNGYIPVTWTGDQATAGITSGQFLDMHVLTTQDILNYVLYSGDIAFARSSFANVQKAEQFTMSFQDDTGLLDDDLGACLHDIGYTECAHTTEINVEAYTSLLAAAQLADLVGQPGQAATWRAEAATLRTTINDLLYDPLRGAYLQALEDPGIISQTGTALADYWGIPATAGDAQRSLAYLKATGWNQYGSATFDRLGGGVSSRPLYDEPFPTYYELAARLQQQDSGDASTLLTNYWGHMLADDPRYPGSPPQTMWERMSLDGLPTLVPTFSAALVSQAHDWGAGPAVALTNQVLGVTPTAPGFSSFQVQPHLLGLGWAQGAVPTPHGAIQVSYQTGSGANAQGDPSGSGASFTMTVDVPAGTQATVSVPLTDAVGGAQHHTSVSMDGRNNVRPDLSAYYATFGHVGPGTHVFTYQLTSDSTSQSCSTSYRAGMFASGTSASATSTAQDRTLEPANVTTFTASNATDGNPATDWEGADNAPATLTVQLPQTRTMSGVRLWLGPEAPPATISVSVNDGSRWQPAADITGNEQSLVDVTFTSAMRVKALGITLDGLRADPFGATRARVFEVVPLTDPTSPLPLNTTLGFTCDAAGQSPAQPSQPVDPSSEPGWKLSLVQSQFNAATAPLSAGQTYGQSFTAQGSFNKVGAFLPTYNSATSGATLTLYSGEPSGTLTPIASQTFTNIVDNSWNYLTFPTVPAGTYYLELSEPVGTPAWWYQSGPLTNGVDLGGHAFSNRVVQPDWTMTLQVLATRP